MAITVDCIPAGPARVRVQSRLPRRPDGTLRTLTDEELAWIADPREGLPHFTKYRSRPTFSGLIREKRAWREHQSTTSWRRRLGRHTGWIRGRMAKRRKRTVRDTSWLRSRPDRARHHQPKPMTDQQVPSCCQSKYRGIPLSARRAGPLDCRPLENRKPPLELGLVVPHRNRKTVLHPQGL